MAVGGGQKKSKGDAVHGASVRSHEKAQHCWAFSEKVKLQPAKPFGHHACKAKGNHDQCAEHNAKVFAHIFLDVAHV